MIKETEKVQKERLGEGTVLYLVDISGANRQEPKQAALSGCSLCSALNCITLLLGAVHCVLRIPDDGTKYLGVYLSSSFFFKKKTRQQY